MFITATAPNPLIVKLVSDATGTSPMVFGGKYSVFGRK
jgi:hypothetical protein